MTRGGWVRWYEKVWELPCDEVSITNIRWSIAFALARFNKNAETAAHVLTGLSWDRLDDVPRLKALAARIRACGATDEAGMRKDFVSDFVELNLDEE